MHEHVTLIGPDPGGRNAPGLSSGLPADLLVRSAARIQSVALLYACIFFLAGIFPALLFPPIEHASSEASSNGDRVSSASPERCSWRR